MFLSWKFNLLYSWHAFIHIYVTNSIPQHIEDKTCVLKRLFIQNQRAKANCININMLHGQRFAFVVVIRSSE